MTLIEKFTKQFYDWERHGRGWAVFSYPVDFEPPFVPFFYHSDTSSVSNKYIDDGIRPTIISKLINSFRRLFSSNDTNSIITEDELLIEPYTFEDEALEAYSVTLPKEQIIKVEEFEKLLNMLSLSIFPLSFEIIANHHSIYFQFVCRKSDSRLLHSQIKAFYPRCSLNYRDPSLIISNDKEGYIYDYGLSEEFMRPLGVSKSFDLDSYIGLFGILDNLSKGDEVVIQVLFKGVQNSWAQSIIRSVYDNNGAPFFLDAPEMTKLAEEKVSAPLFAVIVRAIVFNDGNDSSTISNLVKTITQISGSKFNSLIPLSREGYDSEDILRDVFFRQSHRLGMLINSRELVNLVHFPSVSVSSKKLSRDYRKTKEAANIFLGHKLVLGKNVHQSVEVTVSISPEQRLKHLHVIGATGTGKSTLLHSMIVQDITNGEGVAVIDPHGDLIENILPFIQPSRHNDVLIIDPADSEFPVGLNILKSHSDLEKEILASDLVAVFKRLSTSWGDQMNSVFANSILAFLESSRGGTLIDLRKFLIEKEFRAEFLKTVTDPSIIYYWNKEYPLLKSSSIGPILTRLDSFLRPKVIRNMVAQDKSIDFEHILDSKKILLIKLSQGLIGEENSYLMGAFIVSKLQQAAMSRQSKPKTDRSNYYLYIDEFQNFITPSMSTILSGARKYHMGMILAHQDMQQLSKHDTELASSVIANAGTRICFRIGEADAKKFENSFSSFDAFDLQNLDTGQAIVRMERPDNDCNLDTIPIPDLDSDMTVENRNQVIESSRNQYGTPRTEVELLLQSMHEMPEPIRATKEVAISDNVETVPARQEVTIKERQIITPKISESKKKESEHRYLQMLIKKMADSRGFKSSIEEPTPDGKGSVDVSLERNGKRIAIEIKDTTNDDWELHNISKCLSSGYDIVIECVNDLKTIERLNKRIQDGFEKSELAKIKVLNPESIFSLLDSIIAKEASGEVRMKGYKVKVEYNSVSEIEASRIKETITKSVVNSLKGRH